MQPQSNALREWDDRGQLSVSDRSLRLVRAASLRRFLLRLSYFVPFVLVMAAVNWTVDPARFFGRSAVSSLAGYEAAILEDLRAGHPHTVVDTYNLPVVLEERIRDQDKIDVMVLGSSISTPFHSANFPGEVLFNGAVPGGDLEESMCAYELACECQRRPTRIVLEVHGWGYMLGERKVGLPGDFGPSFQRLLKRLKMAKDEDDLANRFLNRPVDLASNLTLGRGWFDPYDKLISPRYLQLALRVLARRYWDQDRDGRGTIPKDKRNVLYPDGSTEWSPSLRNTTPADIRQRFAGRKIRVGELEGARPDPVRCRLFEAFLLDVLGSGTRVDLLLTPQMHWLTDPISAEYKAIGRETPASDTQRYLLAIAKKHNLRVFGTFEQKRTELTDEDYVDDVHVRRESIGKLLHTRLN
jgi:hypothetical protein